jgi:hypothetical protein
MLNLNVKPTMHVLKHTLGKEADTKTTCKMRRQQYEGRQFIEY